MCHDYVIFFFNYTATTEIYTLSLHDALPILTGVESLRKLLDEGLAGDNVGCLLRGIKREEIERGQVLSKPGSVTPHTKRSEEHTSALQSQSNIVCRLLLDKKIMSLSSYVTTA